MSPYAGTSECRPRLETKPVACQVPAWHVDTSQWRSTRRIVLAAAEVALNVGSAGTANFAATNSEDQKHASMSECFIDDEIAHLKAKPPWEARNRNSRS